MAICVKYPGLTSLKAGRTSQFPYLKKYKFCQGYILYTLREEVKINEVRLIMLPYICSILCLFFAGYHKRYLPRFCKPTLFSVFVKYQRRVVTTCVGDIKGWCSCARSSSCWPLHSACLSERFLFIHSFKYCLASGLGSLLQGNTEMLSKHRYATRANKYLKCKHLYVLS